MSAFIEVRGVTKLFPIPTGFLGLQTRQLRAVDNAGFHLNRGEVLGLVGESGSGKTTLGRCVLRLIEPTEGTVMIDGVDVTSLDEKALRRQRRHMQIVFQDPYSSLNPRKTVRGILTEARAIHGLDVDDAHLVESLERVGLAREHLDRLPHEFSGGQRQRIGIARALTVGPAFIVADEPVSALDVSIQAQIINLFADLKEQLDLAMLFIGHDLGVIEHVSDRVMVLYLGRVMEIAPVENIYSRPRHPYTEALLSARPIVGRSGKDKQIILKGEQPSPANPPSGCVFRTRCPYAIEDCARTTPPLTEVTPGHFKSCIRDDVPK